MNKYLTRLVKSILMNNEAARDNCLLLIKEIHDKEMQIWAYDRAQYYDAVFQGHMSSMVTINRIWRLVQEKFPELRGKEWEERQKQGGVIALEMADEKELQLSLFQ